MKNSKLVKVVMGAIISLIVVTMANQVFADNVTDLTNALGNSSSSSNNSSTNNITSNTALNNTTRNNTVNNTIKNNSVLTTNNTSSYNNTSLPKTGIEDHIPATILLVVFGVSAVYAYKKIQDYRNI
ncbi:MAG: hypothetical protein BHW00_05415 [Clostridium sp. 26_22]|nr:MAG: hypothetical protein BHW00_05415 [Clostridium sp. 26_22]